MRQITTFIEKHITTYFKTYTITLIAVSVIYQLGQAFSKFIYSRIR